MMTRKKLYKLAEEAGLFVERKGDKVTIKRKDRVVVFYPNSIVRGDIDLSVSCGMTVKEAAETLDLKD